jgi:hypothetical protein
MGADRIEQGVLSKTVIDSPGSILVDPISGGLAVVTKALTLALAQSTLLALGAQTALTTITTAQTLFTFAVPAGLFNKVGRTFRVTIVGIYTSAGGSTPTITIALKLGSVTLCTITTSAIDTAANTNLQWRADFLCTVVTIGTGATIEAHGSISFNLSANTAGAALSTFGDQNVAPSSAVDLTIAENLVATIAASGAVSSAQVRSATVVLVS